jgi:hemoglobin-like flavoprotein
MNTELVAQTWDALDGKHAELIGTFYERFFQRFPHYRPLFPGAMDHQMKKMVRTMALVARLSDDQPIIAPHLERVGDRHGPYKLGEEDLQNFKQVFLETLGEHCGADWGETCIAAWNDAFDRVIIPLMMKGMFKQ